MTAAGAGDRMLWRPSTGMAVTDPASDCVRRRAAAVQRECLLAFAIIYSADQDT